MKKLLLLCLLTVMGTGPLRAADVVIGLQNWPTASATAYVLKEVIEKNLGLSVELQNGTNPIIFEAMNRGSMDIMPEVWLPNQQNLYDAYVKQKGTVVLNPNGIPAEQGICVPSYVVKEYGISSVYDLADPAKAKIFDTNGDGKGNMWVGNPGDASGNVEKIKAKSYGYDTTMDLDVYDEAVNFATLGRDYKQKKPWISFCYTPHYIFSLYKLTFLKQPPYDKAKWHVVQPTQSPNWLAESSAPVAWPTGHVHIGYRKALESKNPALATLLHNIKLTSEDDSAWAYDLVIKKEAPEAVAKAWVDKNQSRIIGWLTK